MSNIKKLLDIIDSRDFTSYNEIETLILGIDKTWRPETAHCQLRKAKPNRREYKYKYRLPSSNNPVIGYKPYRDTPIGLTTSPHKPITDDLNQDTSISTPQLKFSFKKPYSIKDLVVDNMNI